MTLARLMELYQAEQQGKQIMMYYYNNKWYDSYERTEEVKLFECDLCDLAHDNDGDVTMIFFIKDEEDKFGNKLNF